MSRRVVYTKHAHDRMAQRNVTREEVLETILNHHTTFTDPDGNRNYVGHVGGRPIRVVIGGDGVDGDLVVLTVIAD